MPGSRGSLFTCDVICYGVPSPGAFQSFCALLEKKSGKRLGFYTHRGRGIKEGGDERATYEDGSTESGTVLSRVWTRLWFKCLCRESCFRCAYHSLNRPGDLTLGDFWGMSCRFLFRKDEWGTSCVIANSSNGALLLEEVSNNVLLEAASMEEVANAKQPMLLHPPIISHSKEIFWRKMYESNFECACREVGVLGFDRKVKDIGKLMLGMIQKKKIGGEGHLEKKEPLADFAEMILQDEYPIAFAARNRDNGIRRMSSSGGIFYALASYVINDLGGVVYGCAFDQDLRAVHIRCETVAEAERCMGSKYSQSDMGDSIRLVRDDLKSGRTVLFTGTPCQVAAVRATCDGGGCLLTADVVCHGVPSPEAFRGWIATLESARGRVVVGYEHRPKNFGWGHFENIIWNDGSVEHRTRWADAWRRYFYDDRSLRPSCYRCPYTKIARDSDITIADFWGIENTPYYLSEDKIYGVSLVLANTSHGLYALSQTDADYVKADLELALPRNPMLQRSTLLKDNRSVVWESLYRDGMLAMMRNHHFLLPRIYQIAAKAKSVFKRTIRR